MRNYNIIVKKGINYKDIVNDLIKDYGTETIPNRPVEISEEWPNLDRLITVILDDDEVEQLKQDTRIEHIEIPPEEDEDIIIGFDAIQEGDFSRVNSSTGSNLNWGMIRVNNPTNIYGSGTSTVEDYEYVLDGEGVDVVIMDSGITPDHPEFLDENGVSRVQLIDWSAYGNGLFQPDYFYKDENGHGTHVAATVAGKTFGWAKKALIYSMRIQLGHPDGYTPTQGFNLIKAWHQSKPIDPYTGLKRPTIVNMSWATGALYPTFASAGLTVTATGTHRGTPFNVSWTAPDKPTGTDLDYGFWPRIAEYGSGTNVRLSSFDALTDELIDAGIHVCIAAGNRGFKIDVPGGLDYNNDVTYAVSGTATNTGRTFDFSLGPYYYHRGSSPFSDRAFMVGAIDYRTTSGKDRTDGYTNRGPGVDLYSPGSGIKSAWTDETVIRDRADRTIIESRSVTGSPYYANSAYYQRSIQGTSMATPQVTGVGAIYLSANPQLTPAQLKSMILSDSKTNQLVDSGLNNDYNNIEGSLTGGANRILFNRYATSIHKQAIGGVGNMGVPYTPEILKTISLSTSTVTFSETIPDQNQTFTSGIITLRGTPGTRITTIGEGGENFSFPNITEIPSVGYVNFRINFTPQYGPLQLATQMTFIGPSNTVVLNISGEVTNTSYSWQPRIVSSSSNPNPNQFDETENFYMALYADMKPEPAPGTEVTYSITGVDENDIVFFLVNGNSQSVTLTETQIFDPDVWGRNNLYIFLRVREDNLTEGTETLTFTVNGNSVSANILDTSTGDVPSYTLRTEPANTTELNEGDSVAIFVDYSNAPLNDIISWSVDNTKLSAEDLTVGSLTGSITLANDASGPGYSGSVQLASFTIAEDVTAEGQEQLDFSIDKTDVTGLSIVINDTSIDYVYNFSLTASTAGPVNEGDTIDITLTAQDGAPGTELAYTITGIDALDLSSGSLTGVFTLQEPAQLVPGVALSDTLTFTIAEDATSELPETLTLVLDDYPDINLAIAITDTSKSLVSYTLGSVVTELNEGDTFSISLDTTSVEVGSTIPYTVTGITQDDLSSGSLTGSFTIVADPAQEGAGIASTSFTLAADELTEGTETFILTITTQDLSTQSISIPINDTSTSLEYRVVRTGPTSIVEDSSSIIFWVYASGPSDLLTYEIVGDVTDDDFVIESIYRSTTGTLNFSNRISSDTKEPDMPYYAAKFFKLKEDYLTEGDETLQFTVPEVGLSSEIYTVADLSKTPTVSLQSAYDNRNEGLEYLAILTATGAPAGYTITGKLNVNPTDLDQLQVSGQTISLLNKTDPIPITFTVGAHGTTSGLNADQTYIRLGLKADSLTEGPETLSITLDDFAASLSLTINDTSQGVVTYTISGNDTVPENGAITLNISVEGITNTVTTIPFKIDTSSTISATDISRITDFATNDLINTNYNLGGKINVPVSRQDIDQPYEATIYIFMEPNLVKENNKTMVFSSFDDLGSKNITVVDVDPIISVEQSTLSVNEGETVNFDIAFRNFGYDTDSNPLTQDFAIKFTKDGNVNTDFGGTTAQGEFVFTATSGQISNITLIANDDATTEGDEVIDYEIGVVGGDVWYTGGQITIVDTSQSPTPVTYSLTRSIVSQPETSTATQRITLTTTGLDSGTVVPFTISGAGVTTSDFDRMYVNGNQFTVDLNHFFIILADGTSEVTIYAAADQTTEGDETINLALSNGAASVSWTYQDDSIPAASYEITTNKSIVNEGDSIIITLTYTNHSGSTFISPTFSGAGFDLQEDVGLSISFSPLTIGGGPYSIIRGLPITEDLITEGNETVTISIPGASTSFTIADTSTSPEPTVTITTDKSSYNEGEIITFTLTYNNLTETSKTYRILRRGSSANTGEEFTTGGNGVSFSSLTTGTGGPYTATSTLGTTEDQTTEGNEIFDIYDPNDYSTALASWTIVDTSTTPQPTYSISSTSTSVNEGAIILFDLVTTNVAQGTQVTASLTPANRFSPSQITFTIEADGTDRVGTTVLENDNLNDTTSATITVDEDAEANYSFTINDTSTQPVTYQLASSKSALAEGRASGDYITVISIQTTGLAVGTRIPYTISGASLSDFTSTQNRNGVSGVTMSLTGDFIIGQQVTGLPGYASFTLATVADALTEGNETVTVSLNNGEASVSFIINDTSTGAISASGGTVQTDGTYNYHVFTSGGTFTVNSIGDSSFGNKVDVLLVGGGGGGGKAILLNSAADATGSHSYTNGKGSAGGGGGGAEVLQQENVTVSTGDSWTVSVGQGGGIAGDGTESSISGTSSSSAGGGGGGDYSAGNPSPTGTGGGGGGGVLSGGGIYAYLGGAGTPAGGNASFTNNADGTTSVFGGAGGSNSTNSVIYSTATSGGGGTGGRNDSAYAPSTPNSQPGTGGIGGNNPLYVYGPANMDPTKSYITNGQPGSQGIVVFRYRIR